MTPEGKVKKAVKTVLAMFGEDIDGFWPVPNGIGESHLDYVGCCRGWFFSVETKAPGKKPTPRQVFRIGTVHKAGGKAFVIDGTAKTDTIEDLAEWLISRERKDENSD